MGHGYWTLLTGLSSEIKDLTKKNSIKKNAYKNQLGFMY